MKRLNYIFLVLCCFNVSVSAQSLLIKDVTIISSNLPAPQSNMDVFIENGVIQQIAPIINNTADKTMNAQGRFLIPGLIDSHVHLGSNGGIREDLVSKHAQLLKQFQQQEPKSYLYFGFTTVVDLNQSENFVSNWESLAVKPDLIYCKALPLANGYGMAFLPENIRFQSPYFIYDENQKEDIPKNINLEEHSPNVVIKKVKSTKASCIKTFNESGFGGLWNWPTPTNKLIKSLKDEANKAGLVHFHHGNSLESQRQAADMGINVMAHGLWHWGLENRQAALPNSIKTILDKMITNGTAYQPTIQVLAGELRLFDSTFLDDDHLYHSLPTSLIHWYQKGGGDWFKNKLVERINSNPKIVEAFLGKKPSGEIGETSKAAINRLKLVINYLNENGAKILLASDSPSSPTYTNPPGYNGLLELISLHEMGLSLKQVFNAATINNAKALNLENEIGTVQVGKKANLLILNENPLVNIRAYDTIEKVIISGNSFSRVQLSAKNS